MSTFLLIRHTTHEWLNYGIAGRLQGVHLNSRGRDEAASLAQNLKDLPVEALYSSPLVRTWETSAFLARAWNLPIVYNAAFLEIDFGKWTGLSFEELERDPQWAEWNNHRDIAYAPGGESMRQVRARAVDELNQLALQHSGSLIAIVTHGDIIRAILLHCLERSLDAIHELKADPGSVAVVEWQPRHREALRSNFPATEKQLISDWNPRDGLVPVAAESEVPEIA